MSSSDNYFIVAKIDEDDPKLEKYKIGLHLYPEVIPRFGLSNNKIHSINRSLDDIPYFDIIIIMSDDIRWDVKGFDDELRKAFTFFSPQLNGTIHVPDDHGKQKTSIVSILGVNLFKELGYLYYPEYKSVFCDDDFTQMTKLMNRYAFINKRMFTHLHPLWGLSGWDTQYRETESKENYNHDREVFLKRKQNNFGIR